MVSTDASYSFTVNSNRTLKANFAIKTFTVTIEATTGGAVTGSGTYDWGTDAVITATPSTGYSFVNWTENGIEVSTNATYTFTVYKAWNLVANFKVSTGISDVISDEDYRLYPNPAKQYVYLDFNDINISTKDINVALYDVSGRVYQICESVINQNNIKIIMPNVPQGIYFMGITIDGKKFKTKKIVILSN